MSINTTNSLVLTQEERAKDSTVFFGFWVYLMTDLVLFASLFAVYAVLRGNTFGGPSMSEIVHMPYVLVETVVLLTSSFTMGLTILAARYTNKGLVLAGLIVTGVLGATFVGMELSEFHALIAAGHGPQQSGFLSSYFTLVGTHGLHVVLGLLWMVSLIISVASRGLCRSNMRKLVLLSLFWHFLDLVWIFIFTFVYLLSFV